MRLFVAIDLPAPVKDQLERLSVPITGAKWVQRPAFHLTLRFLGDGIPEAQLDEIRAALAAIEAPPFEMALRGVGQFSRRVLWAGVDAPPALAVLHGAVGAALAGVGFPQERRPFNPHITLARLRDDNAGRDLGPFLEQNDGFATAAFPVDGFVLFSSLLTQQGARYTRQSAFQLR